MNEMSMAREKHDMNNSSVAIRPAEVSDAAAIAATIRSAFPDRLLDLFIYGCPGIDKYIAEQIRIRNQGCDKRYTVAVANGNIVACAEIRRIPDQLFLNYIAVLAPYRSLGLGGQLLHKALMDSRRAEEKEVVLDVLDLNTNALNWYQRLGFRMKDAVSWRECSSDCDSESPIIVADYAQAQACQHVFGFSKFAIQVGRQNYEIGRLGDNWFRLTNPAALKAPGLVAGLKTLSPRRKILLLLGQEYTENSLCETQELIRTHRLVVKWDVLQNRLKQI